MNKERLQRSFGGRVTVGSFVSAMLQLCARDAQAAQLPIPCVVNCASAGKPVNFVSTGAASAVQSGNTLTVQQTTNSATLNWQSFNISADGKVVFQQPTNTSVALNRIYDANPSSIFGSLSANGQLYLINANGFLFGSTAKVNVAGLLASSLNMSDSTFNGGILSAITNNGTGTALAALQPFPDATGTNTGVITVQPGAQLTAADGGRLLLAAPTVVNGGTLAAPDGQIILAAGQAVYLQASSSSDVRGLLVEVDTGGKAWNQLTGQLSAPRGNITLAGLTVNQDGRISATTTVAANGSITLQAADGTAAAGAVSAGQGGTLELGANSITEVLPEYSDTATAVDAQAQLPSEIALSGEQVFMQGGTINAPSGKLSVMAAANLGQQVGQNGTNAAARIRIDPGTTINLAGSDAEVPISQNLVTVQLRGNELEDDPTQRNGALRGQTVTVDMRADGGAGTPIANVSGEIAAVGKNIAQRTTAGGTATFLSEGDVVVAQGAAINVSGGKTTYDGGVVQTTQLVGANGKLYDIGSANPLMTYTGVVNPTFTQTYNQWGVKEVVPTPGLSHYESGYVQGANAGTVQFAAPAIALNGSLQAATVNGRYQRTTSTEVQGGTLIIGEPLGAPSSSTTAPGNPPDFLSPSVSFVSAPATVAIDDSVALPSQTLQLPVSLLTTGGFSNTQIYSDSRVTLPSGLPLQLTPGSALLIEAPRIDIDSGITALGGSLSFENVSTVDSGSPNLPRLGVVIGPGVTLDVSGQWTNDSALGGGVGTAPTLQNAGSISMQLNTPGSELLLGNQVSLKADGGAWLGATGNITNGAGGSITLDANPAQAALQLGQGLAIEGFGVGTATGGTFSLTAPRISISQGKGTAWTTAQSVDDLTSPGGVLDLYAPLFSNYGFSAVNLSATGAADPTGNGDVLTVTSGTTINAQALSWQLASGFQKQRTGGTVAPISQAELLPQSSRSATAVSLSVLREKPDSVQQQPGVSTSPLIDLGARDQTLGSANLGNLDVQVGASIQVDPGNSSTGGSISLTGLGSVLIGGTLRAPGGAIAANIAVPYADTSGFSTVFDPGYQANQGIDLGTHSILDVSGAAVLTPNGKGLLLGDILPGGSVTLNAQRGTVVAEPGSLIDIAGAGATLDIPNANARGGYTREVVASAGGSLTVGSPESISLLGELDGKAGVGSSGAAAAGSLEIDLTRSAIEIPFTGGFLSLPQFPGSSLEIELVDSIAGNLPTGPSSALAILGVQQLEASGIDSLTLKAGGASLSDNTPGNILINTSQPLSLARQITLDSPTITAAPGVNETLQAAYVQIGKSGGGGTVTYGPTTGSLTVLSQQMNLLGDVTLVAGSATLASSGDVQLEGTSPSTPSGSLTATGDLAIDAARVYPDTGTTFKINSLATNGTVTIAPVQGTTSNGAPSAPLSAAGSLQINAPNILISGTLMAPFGSIDLEAANSLTLTSTSRVSVSGAGLDVPYGQTQYDGGQWIYNQQANQITGVPAKQVTLTSPNVKMAQGATVDLSGGGDLYAYEWVPGLGGTKDSLAAGTIPGLYAIVPSLNGAAPYDPAESGAASHTQTVYLSGVAGLPAGFYSLLPPRYALLTGAYLVQVEPSFTSAVRGQIGALADGTPVVAGYLSSAGTALHSGATEYEGFAVYAAGPQSSSYAQQLAAYNISYASSYFTNAAAQAGTTTRVPLPADAGTLNIIASLNSSVNSILDLQGNVLTAAAKGGRGAQINISAPDLEISANGTSTSGAPAVSGAVLQSWNPGSLTLGGITSSSTDGISVSVDANSVTVDDGVHLSADQILVVAQQAIELQSGASLLSTSAATGVAPAALPAVASVSLMDAAGQNPLPQAALLAVSDLTLPVVSRSGASNPQGATITLDTGSSLNSRGALALDAPGQVTVADGTINGTGASWSLSSSSIAFVDSNTSNANQNKDTLNIDSNLLASMQQASALRIASADNIDLFATVSLGASSSTSAPTLSSLTLIGNSIHNMATGDSVLGAGVLTLEGVSAATSIPTASAGTGTLSLVANTLDIGPGMLAVNGFGRTQAQVGGAVVSTSGGNGGQYNGLSVGGDLVINVVELTATPDSQTASQNVINASGALTIGAPTQLSAGNKLPTLVGGDLTLSGNVIEDAGAIVMPSGLVTLTSATDLHLAGTASILAGGTTLHAVDQSANSPGGIVTLTAIGNLTLDNGATISVAGAGNASAGASPAGSLNISGGGKVDLSGQLLGQAGSGGGAGGSFALDAGQLTGGFTALASNLSQGGFTNAVDVRVRSGDLDLASGGTLTANQITLAADTGAVDIAGKLYAPSASQRGFIGLYGGTGVTLQGELHADGSGSSGRGGEIELSSTCSTCSVTLAQGSVITAAGAAQMGELIVRAPAVSGPEGVAINPNGTGIGADVSNVGQVILEPVVTVAANDNVSTAQLQTYVSTASNFWGAGGGWTTASTGIGSRLTTGKTPVSVQLGLEIQDNDANNTLTLSSLDLSQYSQSGEVVDLTVRAAGYLQINGTISDGYTTTNKLVSLPNSDSGTNLASGTLRFVAGADLNGANPLATISGSAADLNLSPGAIVRTGTGDLHLVAAHDVVFGSGASAYTSGTAAVDSFKVSNSVNRMLNFATDGGNVVIKAGNDVVGSPVVGDSGNYSVTGWQLHEGNGTLPAQYGVDFAAFDWNVGALGGGDVSVSAGHNVTNLSAAVSDSLVSAAKSPTGSASYYGVGGGLAISAGGDIGSAQLYVAAGTGTLTAGGGLTSANATAQGVPVGSSFALGDAQISVWARQSIDVGAIYNPTTIQSTTSLTNPLSGWYFTYGTDSAVNLESTDGNVALNLTTNAMQGLLGLVPVTNSSSSGVLTDLPPNLSVTALQSDISLSNSAILYPSSTGQLVLYAGRDIIGNSSSLIMSDSPASAVRSAVNPTAGAATEIPSSWGLGPLVGFGGDIHVGDTRPALITAGRDISDGLTLSIPKAAQIVAGRDILSLNYRGQNTAASDTTLISAGRDLTYGSGFGAFGIALGGPGSLDVLAGRNVDLGFGSGIITVGNLYDPNLPSPAGANVTVMAGLGTQGADYSSFLQNTVAPSSTYQSELTSYVESEDGQTGLTFSQAQTAFEGFNLQQQGPFIDKVFFNELLLSGREANSGSGAGFARGYAAIDSLFPNSRTATASGPDPYSGDLNLIYSQIYTEAGGNISIMVPGGKIDAGIATAPAAYVSTFGNKAPSLLGIVAEGTGDINIYSKGNVTVDQSRIFTLGGGNILIWSDEGNIDAGNGAKSSLSIPPPSVSVSSTGVITFNYTGAVAGSGIRTITTQPDTPFGSVDLDAPVGTVNAGDAGIGAAGNINIAAQHVVGVNNITFGGTATGVPPEVGNLGATLSGASAAASSTTNSSTSSVAESNAAKQETTPLASTALSWLDVFVTGLGDENCKPEDLECLKRQKQ